MRPKLANTRYPGATSFADSILANQLFFGRKDESKKLFYLIASENLTVLYSKSGYGKTSLLQAGVFGLLRSENYYPVSVRFNKKGLSPQEIITSEISYINSNTDLEVIAGDPKGKLAGFFKGLEIWSASNKLLTPIIVLDQFEEIFSLNHNIPYRLSFIEELATILNEAKEGLLSIRFVISIREDFLGHLEKLAARIPSIFSSRFRLEALSIDAAKDAIVSPGTIEINDNPFVSPGIEYSPEALNELVEFLSLKRIEGELVKTEFVEPIQLQIVCSELEERAIEARNKKKVPRYTVTKENLGARGGLSDILRTFYDKQIDKAKKQTNLSDDEVRAVKNLVEKELIIGNRRIPLDYEAIIGKEHMKKEAIDLLIENKLLKIENYQQNSLVEISHDALVEPILKSLEKRETEDATRELAIVRTQLEANSKRLRTQKTAIAILICSLIAGAIWLYVSYTMTKPLRIEAKLLKDEKVKLNDTLRAITLQIETLKKIKDSAQLDYILSVGSSITSNNAELDERMKADSVLKKLVAENRGKLNTDIEIEYFRKNTDDTKTWVAIKELGYTNSINRSSVIDSVSSKTNGIFYGPGIKILDMQVIALALIRAGFKIQRVADIKKQSTIQIFSRKYNEGDKLPPPLTINEVINATNCHQLDRGYKG